MKNKIVVPIDLTPASKNAFLYAVELASKLELEVEVFPLLEQQLFVMESLRESFYGFKEKSLMMEVSAFLSKALSGKEVSPDVKIKINMTPYASVFDEKFPTKNDANLVVFGIETNNRYAYRLSQRFALEISKKLDCDALFIPTDRVFRKVEKMLFVADYDFADIPLLDQWQEIGENIDAEFHFLFGTGECLPAQTKEEIYHQLFADGSPDVSFQLSLYPDYELEAALKSYIDEADIDMVIVHKPGLTSFLKPLLESEEISQPILISSLVVLLKVR